MSVFEYVCVCVSICISHPTPTPSLFPLYTNYFDFIYIPCQYRGENKIKVNVSLSMDMCSLGERQNQKVVQKEIGMQDRNLQIHQAT